MSRDTKPGSLQGNVFQYQQNNIITLTSKHFQGVQNQNLIQNSKMFNWNPLWRQKAVKKDIHGMSETKSFLRKI